MTEVNVPLLRKAVEWVEEQSNLPEIDRQWNQRAWKESERDRAEDFAFGVANEMWAKTHGDEDKVIFVKGYTTTTGIQVEGHYRFKPEYSKLYRKVMNQLLPKCKTAYCVAGYVCAINGEGNLPESKISNRAIELLGIPDSPWGTHPLFAGGNSAEDVRQIAEEIAGERL